MNNALTSRIKDNYYSQWELSCAKKSLNQMVNEKLPTISIIRIVMVTFQQLFLEDEE